MANETLATIITRAVNDAQFRDLLFQDSAQALAGYALSEDEKAMLKNLSRENFDAAASELDARISRGGLNLGGFDSILPIRRP